MFYVESDVLHVCYAKRERVKPNSIQNFYDMELMFLKKKSIDTKEILRTDIYNIK